MKPDKRDKTEEQKERQRQEKAITNEPQTADDLSVNEIRQVTQPGENPTVHNVNGRNKNDVQTFKHSDGKSAQSRDNDSDTANGLMRFGDNEDADQTPEVTEKFMNESVTKGDK
jgi:hypothetical protein